MLLHIKSMLGDPFTIVFTVTILEGGNVILRTSNLNVSGYFSFEYPWCIYIYQKCDFRNLSLKEGIKSASVHIMITLVRKKIQSGPKNLLVDFKIDCKKRG